MGTKTFSEVFYKAACRMSRVRNQSGYCNFSCNLVAEVETGKRWDGLPRPEMSERYSQLMTESVGETIRGSKEIGWPINEFRTFMLLMASEAVKYDRS
jgi:hypothetical protein